MGLYKRCACERPDACDHPWWARFEIAGHEVRRSTRTPGRRAAEVEERRLRVAAEGSGAARRSAGRLTLADLGGLDVARAAAEGATEAHQKAIEYSWSRICGHFKPDTEPRTLTFDGVTAYILARRQSGAMGQTIARELRALRWGASEAHERGHWPIPMIRWPKVKRDAIGTKRRGRLHPPAVLAEWMRELPPYDRDMATVALLTSLRRAELSRLTADWIEPAPEGSGIPAIVRVPASAAKSRKERVLPVAPAAFAALERRAGEAARGQPLFPRRMQWRNWDRARKRIGYPTPISLRDLRHTWGTLANRNVGIDAARDGLGHASLAMTQHYISGDIGRTARAALVLEGMVGTADPAQQAKSGDNTEESSTKPQPKSLNEVAAAHVLGCDRCAVRVLGWANAGHHGGDPGTADPAQVSPSPARVRTR